ncbi:hypothetical protein [Niallia sp. NCCP-28]|uniref:hypothetical protein n=1 Tax=Niallia sp. NCCP-28 TaxID=2934712 RepID=UPI00208406F5|nr:hypothetical protein [Niallia sp. NCCP-28]GKU80874.1 hypothetical protein NCCP28_02700 [Niallia sp. NCCP-28]
MHTIQQIIDVVKTDLNTENSEILSLFQTLLTFLFSIMMICGIPFLLYLFFLL